MSERLSSAARGSPGRVGERFAARRRSRRRRILFGVSLFLILLGAGMLYEVRQDAFRISRIDIFGADTSLVALASSTMQGSYLGIVPRDSTFFYPESGIRARIMAEHADIAAVSFFRQGFTGLSIKVSDRVAIARWCGSTPLTAGGPVPDPTRFDLTATSTRSNLVMPCYVFDASGYIFAAAASSTQAINNFTLYAPLESARGEPPAVSGVEPLRAILADTDTLPATFDFARELATFGSPVTHVVITGDEVNLYLKSGTRITYVLGNEQNAFTALTSSKENFNLANGSIDYIDLRFDGKVYLKRKQ